MASDAQFCEWAQESRGWMRRTAYLLSLDWHSADDLVQDALLKMYKRFGTIDPAARDAYARRVLTTVFMDSKRRPWRRELSVETLPDVLAPPAGEGHEDLLQALGRVPPRQRAALVLRYFQDLSVEQTAAALGCSAGTVKSQCARGLDHLRAALGAGDDR